MMPGGSKDGYDAIRHIVEKVAAQVDDGPCVTYIGPGGAGALRLLDSSFVFAAKTQYALLELVMASRHQARMLSNSLSISLVSEAIRGRGCCRQLCQASTQWY